MTREEAEKIIRTVPWWEDSDGIAKEKLRCLSGAYVCWEKEDEKICLDGNFTAEQLEAISWWIKNAG